MKLTTQQNLINAFGGESMAHMRYLHFANVAEKEKYINVNRLFKAIAYAEFIHAVDHYNELKHLKDGFVANSMGAFGPGDTNKNLELAIAGETSEIEEMYPTYIEISKFQNKKRVQRNFEWSYYTEKKHKELFEKAKLSADKDKNVELGNIQVCKICDYTIEGDVPDECPLCKAKKEIFKTYK